MLKLFEMLKATPEAEGKTLFGSYTSKLLKDISSLLKVLEKSNLHIADLGKLLSQYTSFEGYDRDDIDLLSTRRKVRARQISNRPK